MNDNVHMSVSPYYSICSQIKNFFPKSQSDEIWAEDGCSGKVGAYSLLEFF